MKKINVALMGGTGYAAAEPIKRLEAHPYVNLTRISSIDHVGENVGKRRHWTTIHLCLDHWHHR